MITYLGMTLPMAVWSTYTWMKHPSRDNGAQVAIQPLGMRHLWGLALSSCGVTGLFYFILRWLGTPNLGFSTLSVLTSFLAAALTMLRSSYYALAYGANDLVLIVLWVMATREDPAYLPVAVNFTLFLSTIFTDFSAGSSGSAGKPGLLPGKSRSKEAQPWPSIWLSIENGGP